MSRGLGDEHRWQTKQELVYTAKQEQVCSLARSAVHSNAHDWDPAVVWLVSGCGESASVCVCDGGGKVRYSNLEMFSNISFSYFPHSNLSFPFPSSISFFHVSISSVFLQLLSFFFPLLLPSPCSSSSPFHSTLTFFPPLSRSHPPPLHLQYLTSPRVPFPFSLLYS